MKIIAFFKNRLRGLTDAISRYPLTTAFLVIAAIINAIDINNEKDLSKTLLTLAVGAFLSAVSQVVYERFFSKTSIRFGLMIFVIVLTAGYYLIILPASTLSMEIMIRTAVALFALLFAFIWVPVIKSKISFNNSFMIAFKAFFNSLLFSVVIFGGVALIISAIDLLITSVDYRAYSHAGNIIFILFAPMYFLSLIPIYPGESNKGSEETKRQTDVVLRAAKCPKFFEILISYIIIPLITVFTIILLVYIIKNIGGEFWSDNLLEPMIVSYSIFVIVVYLLASELENKFTVLFRKILPKVLVPIVVFQIISSLLSLSETGITHTRYYVILYGLFAAVSGILLSFLPVRKNGSVAALLIIFSIFSIVPPVDAFSISKSSQINLVEKVLLENKMLEEDTITPNSHLSNEDKKTITNAMSYLNTMDYTKELAWLPKDFDYYEDFSDTFGFREYYESDKLNESVYVSLEPNTSISITGYDTFVYSNIYFYSNEPANKANNEENLVTFEKGGDRFSLMKVMTEDQSLYKVYNEHQEELIYFDTKVILDKFYDFPVSKERLPIEEATFTAENENASLKVVAQNVNIDKMKNDTNYMMDLYIFVKVK